MNATTTEVPEQSSQTKPRINSRDGNRELHLQALYTWLHPDLHTLPGIDWTKMPSRIIGYLVNTVRDAGHAPRLALVAATALGTVSAGYLHTVITDLNALFSFMERHCTMWDGSQITREMWGEYVTKMDTPSRRRKCLGIYATVTERYLPDYVERLDPATLSRITPYLLPRLPARFVQHYGDAQEVRTEERRRRKEKSDILVPLHTILVALIQFRKQAAQRLLVAYREACARAEAGEPLPLCFSYEDLLVDVNHDAQTVVEVRTQKKPVVLTFTLWNRRTWVKHHQQELSQTTRNCAKGARGGYRAELDHYFVEFLGPASQFLWFGDLIEQGVFMHLAHLCHRSGRKTLSERDRQRLAYAQTQGVSSGFAPNRPGLLTPESGPGQWLPRMGQQCKTLLFDPESLYRGCLFGAALATLALTNGSRMTELLQVSADRFKGHAYEEKINGQPTGKQRIIWLQYLLPKGKKTEAERQFFPISPQAYELLREIGALLKERHGGIPTVCPHPENTKAEDLKPERYLFQWAATSDGRSGALSAGDVHILIRFILHGLSFRTKQGEPFVVSTHLLRHVHGYRRANGA